MPHYNEADFFASTTTTTTTLEPRRPRRRLTIAIPQPGTFSPAMVPPSPLWEGLDENADTEPFVPYVDEFPPDEAKTMHCLHHCSHRVCGNIVRNGVKVPACWCGEEDLKAEESVDVSCISLPIPTFNDAHLEEIRRVESRTASDRMITIRREDATDLIAQLEQRIGDRTLNDAGFLASLVTHFPGDLDEPIKKLALAIIEPFFNLVTLYLQRTLSASTRRTISVKQLRIELKVYAWSGFEEWADKHCSDLEYEEVMAKMEHRAFIMESSDFGLPGVVSKFWFECLDDVVGALVWRDECVKGSEVEWKVACGGMAAVAGCGLVAGVAWGCRYW